MKPFDESRFDEAFRSKLGNYSVTPPDQVLGKIKQTMSQGPVPGTSWFVKYWMFFAVVGIAGLVVVSLSFMSADDNINTTMNNTIVLPEQNIETNQAADKEPQQIAETTTSAGTQFEHVSTSNTNVNETNVSEKSDVEYLSNTINPLNNEKSAVTPQPTRKPQEISINIHVSPSTCRKPNGSIALSAVNGGDRYFYYWSDISSHTSIANRTNLTANTYSVRVESEDGNVKNYEIMVTDTGSVISQFSHYEISPTAGIPVYFENKSKYCNQPWESTGAVSFKWYFGDGNISLITEPEHVYEKAGSYIVSLVTTSLIGCKDSVPLIYLNISGSEMDLPNVITPNNDGINDVFKPVITGIVQHKCTIFSRSGDKVYEWQGIDGQWDGKIRHSNDDAAEGVYYYIIEGIGSDGHQITKKGFVQLFR